MILDCRVVALKSWVILGKSCSFAPLLLRVLKTNINVPRNIMIYINVAEILIKSSLVEELWFKQTGNFGTGYFRDMAWGRGRLFCAIFLLYLCGGLKNL